MLCSAEMVSAQGRRLTLEQALRLADEQSEAMAIARAGEARAQAGAERANSFRLPQLNFTGGYSRTLASEFEDAFASTGPSCAALAVDPTRPIDDRVAELERAASCGAIGPDFGFSNLPFGQRNIYQLTVSFSQTLYAGGRIAAQRSLASQSRDLARMTTAATRADVALDVSRAYFDAALSDRLVGIAELALQQLTATYDQTRLAFEAGRLPEFELLRAQVARDNQRPEIIRRRADRDIAHLRLKQLLELAPQDTIVLDVDLEAALMPAPEPFVEALAKAREAAALDRTVVRQAELAVGLRESALAAARAERRPQVALTSSYGRVGYPSDGAFPKPDDFRTNWSAGVSVEVPVFSGFRLRADERAAAADLAEAQARLDQTRELADLDAATALQDLAAAEAVWQASAGTIEQATRAYQVAELRFREGLSTQLELSDSRLALQVAQANRAQAAHALQLARVRAALLPDLPIGR